MVAMNSDEFARLDTNKDGQLSRIELPKAHALAAHFDMLDADNNGTLSADDFANGSEM
jgi:Ca2+-binding EF-hand superfamily protein